MAMNVDETNATLMVDNSDLMKGKAIFGNNCTVCHTETGGGSTGPNLTDDFWIYGPDIKTVFGVIKYGKANGMPSHESKLNPIQLQQVSSYILHLEDVSVEEGGKEPQGDFYGDEEEESSEDPAEENTTADAASDSIDVASNIGSND
jgi:cytochrome c oxidase cbb3-type subunit 3